MVFGPTAPPEISAQVDPNRPAELPGVPFYSHYGVCTQETVWLEPQTTLALTVIADNNPPLTRTMTLNGHALAYSNQDVRKLVAQLSSVNGKHNLTKEGASLCPGAVAAGWKPIAENPAYQAKKISETKAEIQDAVDVDNMVEVASTADIGTAVDYSKVYYLNSRSPWIGTGSVEAKLGADGTLTDATASTDDETWSSVLSTIGTLGSGALTGWSTVEAAKITGAAQVQAAQVGGTPSTAMIATKHVVAPPPPPVCKASAGDYWPEVIASVEYAFTVTSGGYKHDHKKTAKLVDNTCNPTEVFNGSFTVTPIGGGDKPDKGAIGVSGSITLPKPQDAAKQ
jgi:hypothetical protein